MAGFDRPLTHAPDSEALDKLAEKFGSPFSRRTKAVDRNKALQGIIRDSLQTYEKDRSKYLAILDVERLEEYAEDPPFFKNPILKNKCPIIHSTLHNTAAKELDRFRAAFSQADPQDLLAVVTNIVVFADEYCEDPPDDSVYEHLDDPDNLGFADLDSEDYGVQSVIGGGIRSQFLYRMHPDRFPYRSREAIWALWYLTAKKTLGSKQDSEFLMIDVDTGSTQQNYFYPYDLFGYYACHILCMLKREAEKLQVPFPSTHRFVVVDSFLSFVARQNEDEINELRQKVEDEHLY